MITWKIVARGRVPDPPTVRIDYCCPGCGQDAELPVLGTPIAQLSSGGIVFEPGERALPETIECRRCQRRYELDQPQRVAS